MSEYTKGEWIAIRCNESNVWDVEYRTQDGGGMVAACGTDEEGEANARLIAAAPLQNQTLEDIYADAELLPDGRYAITEKRLQDISTVIAKATKI